MIVEMGEQASDRSVIVCMLRYQHKALLLVSSVVGFYVLHARVLIGLNTWTRDLRIVRGRVLGLCVLPRL